LSNKSGSIKARTQMTRPPPGKNVASPVHLQADCLETMIYSS